MKYDYLIVGCGFSGSILARKLAEEKNKKILIIDKRDHIGGNAYDYVNEAGILIHKYGPHYFRTDFEDVYKYLSRFTSWREHRYKVKVRIKNKLYSFPVNLATLEEFFDRSFTESTAKMFLDKLKNKKITNPKNAEEQVLKNIGKELYEAFFKGYTEKQWGVKVTDLDPSVTARIPIRTDRNDDYIIGKYQLMPKNGYTEMFKNILNHKNITVKLKTPYTKKISNLAEKIIWTGCIDEYYNHKFGKLKYRSLNFSFISFYNKNFVQECGQINYPEKGIPYTRIVEIKHVTGQKNKNTTISVEYPQDIGDPYYPIPSIQYQKNYEKYFLEAEKEKNVFFTGRLAKYKYLNMDQVVKDALDLADKLY